eukprot:gene1117-1452_t
MSHNDLGGDGLAALMAGLTEGSCGELLQLDLQDNHIKGKFRRPGLEALIDGALSNPRVLALEVQGNRALDPMSKMLVVDMERALGARKRTAASAPDDIAAAVAAARADGRSSSGGGGGGGGGGVNGNRQVELQHIAAVQSGLIVSGECICYDFNGGLINEGLVKVPSLSTWISEADFQKQLLGPASGTGLKCLSRNGSGRASNRPNYVCARNWEQPVKGLRPGSIYVALPGDEREHM